jgi:hypothetical protein
MSIEKTDQNENMLRKIELNESDLRNLEIIFLHARKAVVENENELLNIISFKKSLTEKLNGKTNGQESILTEEDMRNLEVIFLYARRACVENEAELVSIIQFKRTLVEKFNPAPKP